MNRRNLISLIALAPIAGCSQLSSTPTPNIPSVISTDIDLVVSGLRSLLPYIVSPTTEARYIQYLNTIAELAKKVVASQDANSSKTLVGQIIAVTNDALSVITSDTTIKLPSIAKTIITATQVMLPFIATAAGIFGYRTAPSAMSVDQARMVLARRR